MSTSETKRKTRRPKPRIEADNKREMARIKRKQNKLQKEKDDLEKLNRGLLAEIEELKKINQNQQKTIINQQKTLDESIVIPKAKLKFHSYDRTTIDLALRLYYETPSSLSSIPRIMEVYNKVLGIDMPIPTDDTIALWAKRYGLCALRQAGSEMREDSPYAIVMDESMFVCGQILLLLLRIPSQHPSRPLVAGDLVPIGMHVGKSHNSEEIKGELEKAIKTQGYDPDYILTDGCSTMKKGVSLSGYPRVPDVSHMLGTAFEHTYKKDTGCVKFMKNAGVTSFKNVMQKDVAYLLAPKQRSVARFLNISSTIQWAHSVNSTYGSLGKEAQDAFSFIPEMSAQIEEYRKASNVISGIEEEIKNNGASRSTIDKILCQLKENADSGNERESRLYREMSSSLSEMRDTIPTGKEYNASSDIIESTFGVYKSKMASNKRNGITALSLTIPGRMAMQSNTKPLDIMYALESTRTKDVAQWKDSNLMENQVKRRFLTLHANQQQ